jgi:hypothetical protein
MLEPAPTDAPVRRFDFTQRPVRSIAGLGCVRSVVARAVRLHLDALGNS